MQKKFFDIIPPKEEVTESLLTEKSDSVTLEPVAVVKEKRHSRFPKALIGVVTIAVLALIVVFFLPNDVEIKVWPVMRDVAFTETVIIDLNTAEVDLENNIIPGQIVNSEKTGSQEFSSTGTAIKESKAEGTITVYNAYSSSSRSLVVSRFVSADGKLFWSTRKITIPGYHYEGGKLIPGEKEVEVIAAEAGPEYNISATTFALPALAGTALYTTIYAKSFSPMMGGYEGKVGQVTQDDLDNAENILAEKLKSENADQLTKSLEEDFMLPSETIINDISNIKSSQLVGAKVDSFNLEAGIKSTGLAFRKSDIDDFVLANINLNIKQDHVIKEGTLEIEYVLEEVDLETGQMIIRLEVSAKSHADIDLETLKKAIIGKSFKETEIFLNSLPEIDRIELNTGLSLKKTIPEDMSKVEVLLGLD
ncbi:hypothetical protein KKC65_00195 [Patescibacteria group bacterium]|nr:hypothetical protein [Patescibacteria group bacterium]